MTSSLQRLREKLCRELAQSEYDAVVQSLREAGRYGDAPPAQALRAIARHARELRRPLGAMWGLQPLGVRAGRVVGELFSAARHFVLDWLIDAERSYRATLLGLRHGLGTAQLLREVLALQGDAAALAVCTDLIEARTALVVRAEQQLRWFAERPARALRSSRARGRRVAALAATVKLAP